MASLYLDIDYDDIYFSNYEKEEIAKRLANEGFNIIDENDCINLDKVNTNSYSEIELFKLIRSLYYNRQFIKSSDIDEINNILRKKNII